jgi:hypothetical protein
MKNTKNKSLAIAIAILLMLSIGTSIILVQPTYAHTPAWKVPTFAFINVSPNPVGVGQYVNVIMWMDKVINQAAYGNAIRFQNYKLTITDPDGTVETVTFPTAVDTTSSQYYSYTPTKTGNYTFKFDYPGQTYNYGGDYNNDTYLASSATTTLTVQEEQIGQITSYPLPTEYWTRPIYGENTDWWTISSNWLGEGGPQTTASFSGYQVYVPDAVGSLTSHVMWTKALQSGGVVGGDMFTQEGQTYFEGSAYIPRYTNPIIVEGMLIYTEPRSFGDVDSFSGSGVYGPTVCRDLRTGELLWSKAEVPKISFALLFDVQNPNQHGAYQPILVSPLGSTWRAFDAFTGVAVFNATNVPSGTKAMGPNGEYLIYTISNAGTDLNPNYRLCEWNSSKLWYGATGVASLIKGTVDASIWTGDNIRYDWNVSLPWLTQAASLPDWSAASSGVKPHVAKYNDLMLCHNGAFSSGGDMFSPASWTPYDYFAVNLNPSKGALGSVLWRTTISPPAGNISTNFGGCDFEKHVFLEEYKETSQWVAYDLNTGKKMWGPTEPQNEWDYYGVAGVEDRIAMIAYGKVFSQMFSGIIYCYDEMTGNRLWTYGNGGSGNNTASGYYGDGRHPTAMSAIGNGVIYSVTTEHTVSTPIYKGALARAVNATDGTEIWTISSFTASFHSTSYAIADGFSTWFNGYDNSIYIVGRGPSATTVSAPHSGLSWATPLVITGSVIDLSSGTKQDAQSVRFPNGVPVSSDASMKDWMGYIYQQRPAPNNFTGVPVQISVLDSNNNFRTIGVATTDATGTYSLTWTPDIPGDFTVYASFTGTNGYWPSSAIDHFTVMQASTPVSTAEPVTGFATTSDLMTYIVVGVIAIIIAIAIATLLNLRKRT